MFDSPLCDREFTQFPLFSNWGQLDWIKVPILVAVVLLAFLGFRWITQQSKWKRQFRKPIGIVLLTGFTATLLLLLAVADKGLVLFLPTDPGTTAEAIVVLGRGTELGRLRIDTVAELWQAKRAPLVFVSGTGDTPRMLPLLEKEGIPKQALDGEACSLTTPENALFSAAILQAQGIQRILLVTDGPHMWRSLLDFRDQGFTTVIPRTSPLPSDMAFMDKTFLTFREYLFLVSSSVKRLFHSQDSSEANSPELTNLLQLAEQYGKRQQFP